MPTSRSLTDPDKRLIAECAAVIDVPKRDPPDSFVLHAPLELLARALLLERVPARARDDARDRIRALADAYAAAGPPAASGPPLLTADIDRIVLSLAAAGHAPILVNLRPRVPAVAATFGDRLVATELARNPDWLLEWPTTRTTTSSATDAPSGDLAERLAAPPSPGDPGSPFIYPTMHLTEASGLAAEVLDVPLRGLPAAEARRTLLRVAAQSMLQDDPEAAPYGWTHCLTMPQAVLAAVDRGADPDVAVAVAATYVLGFRATLRRVRLEPAWKPEPGSAASEVWTAGDGELTGLVERIVTFGALHPDAHVAKYTLACLDATADDPGAGRLFLAAAAHLHAWWEAHPQGQALGGA
jgi:hypothetical protein